MPAHNVTAVVLAGGSGSRMGGITKSTTKAFLPVAGKPMIAYALAALDTAGFNEIIVIVQEEALQLASYLTNVFESKSTLTVFPVSQDTSTAESLRLIANRINDDFIVMSSDVLTTVNFTQIIDVHRLSNASVTMTFSDMMPCDKDTPYSKRDRALVDVIAIDEQTNRVLYMTNEADLDDDKFSLSRTVLRKYPRLKYRTDWLDCHLYIFKRWVLDYVVENKYIESIKLELVPLLVRKQLKQCKRIVDDKTDIFNFADSTPSYIHSDDIKDIEKSEEDSIRCFIYHTKEFSRRANTIPRYFDCCLQVIGTKLVSKEELIRSTDIVDKRNIKNDSMVGEGCKIADRCSIKSSVVGNHCTLGPNVKIINSIIMDHVTIETKCKIQNTIICNDSYIQSGCDLMKCIVESSGSVEQNTQARDETLANASSKYADDDDGFSFH